MQPPAPKPNDATLLLNAAANGDKGAADRIIKAQGVASGALEKLRHARSLPDHVTS